MRGGGWLTPEQNATAVLVSEACLPGLGSCVRHRHVGAVSSRGRREALGVFEVMAA